MKSVLSFKNIFTLLSLLSLIAFSGCGSSYIIRSEPAEANVFLNETLVGKTPLEIPFGKLPSTDNIRIRVSKEGYATFIGFVPGPAFTNLTSEIAVTLNRGEDEVDKFNRNMGRITQAQKLTMERKFTQALKLVDEAIEENPRYLYAQILKASILFLTKEFTASLAQWQRVIELDPSNTEAIRMINHIKKTGGPGRDVADQEKKK